MNVHGKTQAGAISELALRAEQNFDIRTGRQRVEVTEECFSALVPMPYSYMAGFEC